MTGRHRERDGVLSRRQPAQVGHPHLDQEQSAPPQVRGRITEDVDLPVLRGHVTDGVEHQVGQGELAGYPRRRHVADRDLDLVAARLAGDPRSHRPAHLDAAHRHATRSQRGGDPAGSDGKLKHRAAASQVFKDVHHRHHHFGRVSAARGVIVRCHALREPAVGEIVYFHRSLPHHPKEDASTQFPAPPRPVQSAIEAPRTREYRTIRISTLRQ